MTRKKSLSREDLELWQKVTSSVDRLAFPSELAQPKASKPKGTRKKEPVAPIKTELPAEFPKKPKPSLPKNSFAAKPTLEAVLGQASVNMDPKAFSKMKKGKIKPEGRIDLHGMTVAQAQPALTRYILAAHAGGKRLVLVITGKGRDDPGTDIMPIPKGVLRHQVPRWLGAPPLSGVVLQFSAAHASHGGSGAYYVYLRRKR